MATAKLAARTLAAARGSERAYVLYDEELKGFGLRVMPSGFKSWVVEYRPTGAGRTASKKRVTLGSATSLTAAEARKLAKDMLAAIRGGADPLAAREAAKAAASIAQIAPRFLSEHVEKRRKPSTIKLYRMAVNQHIVPALGALKAASLTKADVIKLHGDLSNKPILANRVVAVLGSMLSWAQKVGLVPEGHNPTTRIEKNPERGRERYLSTAELERLGEALRDAETVGIPWDVDEAHPNAKHVPKTGPRRTVLSPHAVAGLRLLILLGARLGEILNLRWSEIDFERGLLLLPDSKTGRKTIILNVPAIAVLESVPRVGEFVIAGRGPTRKGDKERPRSDLKKSWSAVRRHAGLEGLRLHDLRHSFASVGAGSGLGLPIVGKLLGHTEASTTQRYAHLDNDPLRRASNVIGGTIQAALDGHTDLSRILKLSNEKRGKN